jgi:hypothetical protein
MKLRVAATQTRTSSIPTRLRRKSIRILLPGRDDTQPKGAAVKFSNRSLDRRLASEAVRNCHPELARDLTV